MKISYISANLIKIRETWRMNRMQFGKLVACTGNQIGGYERGSTIISPVVLLAIEDLTGVPAKRLYYEPLKHTDIPHSPLSQSANETPPQYRSDNLSVEERLKRLETKVFGA
ncbi:MAG: helix-turn-helix transcriptional regulator [Saprospiraceae bacterium]|nr:helix-turn-helix transcriptional regulator [Saprospiraceae bacterium]